MQLSLIKGCKHPLGWVSLLANSKRSFDFVVVELPSFGWVVVLHFDASVIFYANWIVILTSLVQESTVASICLIR